MNQEKEGLSSNSVAEELITESFGRNYLSILNDPYPKKSAEQLSLYSFFPSKLGIKQNFTDKKYKIKKPIAKNGLFQIQQRRYLGNKYALLDFIEEIVKNEIGYCGSFCDVFAGTGVVGERFNEPTVKIISNELLYSNYVSLYAWLSPEEFDGEKINTLIKFLNDIKPIEDNYVSKNFGSTYFTIENAKKIGAVRETIEQLDLTFKEKSILLTSLLYAMDKVANTVGHYDAFRRKMDMIQPIKLLVPDIKQENNSNNEIYNKDANELIREIECDILYIDPPYNSRQYCDAYHLLENIIRWKKPRVYGVAKKFDRRNLKSRYNLKSAAKALNDLVKNAKCKHILFSYNNMAGKGNPRSNARIRDREILQILYSKGETKIFEKKFKQFTTGKSYIKGHTERVFWCKVE